MPPLSDLDANAAFYRAVEKVKDATANVRRLVDIENLNAHGNKPQTQYTSPLAMTTSTLQQQATGVRPALARLENMNHTGFRSNAKSTADKPVNDNDGLIIDFDTSFPVKYNCNQIRTRINTFINNGGMKVGEFQDKIRVSPRSYQLFMKQTGPHGGMNSETYAAAHQFFVARENAGLKMPRAKKAKPDRETEKRFSVDDSANPMPKLDGEDAGNVPVFDTCDDVRRKIDAHLKKGGVTQAAFARELTKCVPDDTVSSKNVTDFRNKRGSMAGNTSKAFYAAYVYFEKLRLQEKKPKSKKRQQMEVEHGAGGVELKHDQGPNARVWVTVGEMATTDKNGKLIIY